VNSFDLIVVAIIVLSGVFAFARGFVRELLSIASWLGATFAALYGLPYARPFARTFMAPGPISDAVAAVILFIVALVILSIVTSAMARRVRTSSLSALDRSFGLVFGLLRGVLLVCIGFLILTWVLPPGDQPRWLAEARTAPLLANGADWLQKFVPGRFRAHTTTALTNPEQEVEQAIRAYRTPGPRTGTDAAPHYTPEEQRDLNRLFQQQGGK
jgi:membrane protein required for colicin V production